MCEIYRCTAATHGGARRENQDLYCTPGCWPCNEEAVQQTQETFSGDSLQILGVFDGAGGGACGSLAAMHAMQGVSQALIQLGTQTEEMPLEQILLHAVQSAQQHVCALCDSLESQAGSTAALVAIRGGSFAALSIGDSPIFLFSGGKLKELSKRQNLAAIRSRYFLPYTEEQKYQLVYYLGLRNLDVPCIASVETGRLQAGDRILLCSDGAADPYTAEEYDALAARLAGGATAADFVRSAVESPVSDNATAVLVECSA